MTHIQRTPSDAWCGADIRQEHVYASITSAIGIGKPTCSKCIDAAIVALHELREAVRADDSPPPWNFTKDFERAAKLLEDVQLAGLVTQVYGYRGVLTKLDNGVRIADKRTGHELLYIAAPTEHALEALSAALEVLAGKAT